MGIVLLFESSCLGKMMMARRVMSIVRIRELDPVHKMGWLLRWVTDKRYLGVKFIMGWAYLVQPGWKIRFDLSK